MLHAMQLGKIYEVRAKHDRVQAHAGIYRRWMPTDWHERAWDLHLQARLGDGSIEVRPVEAERVKLDAEQAARRAALGTATALAQVASLGVQAAEAMQSTDLAGAVAAASKE